MQPDHPGLHSSRFSPMALSSQRGDLLWHSSRGTKEHRTEELQAHPRLSPAEEAAGHAGEAQGLVSPGSLQGLSLPLASSLEGNLDAAGTLGTGSGKMPWGEAVGVSVCCECLSECAGKSVSGRGSLGSPSWAPIPSSPPPSRAPPALPPPLTLHLGCSPLNPSAQP